MKHDRWSALRVSRETAERLDAYIAMVLRWNRTINLVSRRDESDIYQRHLRDSLNLLPHLPPHFRSAVDLGSGGGFPGLVLAIATGKPFSLVEADHRKAAFLREAARTTAAPVTVHATRAEELCIAPVDLITARALAPLSTLIDWATPLLAPGGQCVFPKGRTAEEELTAARQQWHMRVEQWPSPLDPHARIFRLSEISRV